MYESLDREFGFDVDVCANDANHKHPRYWTVKDDGLSKDWSGLKCFMNPPYGRPIAGWMRKAVESALGGGALVVAVIPCRTDTRWWGDCMRANEIRLIRGRLHYNDGPEASPFPSCIVVWDGRQEAPERPVLRWVDVTGEAVA